MLTKDKQRLKLIEKEIQATGYRIIYEKGNFQSGHCIVHDKKIIVVNKFLSDKNKIITLLEISATLKQEEAQNI